VRFLLRRAFRAVRRAPFIVVLLVLLLADVRLTLNLLVGLGQSHHGAAFWAAFVALAVVLVLTVGVTRQVVRRLRPPAES